MKDLTLDCETTGLAPKGSDYKVHFMDYPYIVSLAWKINDEETRYFIINQEGRKIPPEATAIHGITDEMCDASPHKIDNVLPVFLVEGQGANFTIGHNIFYDSSTIKANWLRLIQLGKLVPESYQLIEELLHKDRRIDTMMASIKYCNIPGKYGAKWPKLTELHQKLFNEGFEAHNSKDDVNATRRCCVKLREIKVI